MTPTRRRTTPGEAGFALIEVLVSAIVVAIVAAGVMALLQATTRSAANERRHSEAYALAQEDQARLRSLRLSALNRLKQTRPVTLDGSEFTVESTGTFVSNSTGNSSNCATGETSADYVRITSTATWPGSRQPVVIQSIVSPSNGSLDPSHGTLTITTKNAAATALSGVGLSGSGAGTFSGTTDATGCAYFADLPSGNYTVTASGTGLVDKFGNPPGSQSTSVVAGGTATLALEYDHEAAIPVNFQFKSGSSSELVAGTADSVLFFNAQATPGKAYWTATKARETTVTAAPVFPFTAPSTIYAGACEINNPGSGPGQASVTVQPGEKAAPVTVRIPALELTVKNGSSVISGARITITDRNCVESQGNLVKRVYTSEAGGHQSNASNGKAEYGLPWGVYDICASASYSGTNHRLFATNVTVQSFSSNVVRTLDLSGSGSESGSSKTCP